MSPMMPAIANSDARAPRGRMSAGKPSRSSSWLQAFLYFVPPSSEGCALPLSPVALLIVFWYSLAKRFTSYTQMFLVLPWPWRRWRVACRRWTIGWEPWLLGLAIGTWVGGSTSYMPARISMSIAVKDSLDSGEIWHPAGVVDFPSDARYYYRLSCGAWSNRFAGLVYFAGSSSSPAS